MSETAGAVLDAPPAADTPTTLLTAADPTTPEGATSSVTDAAPPAADAGSTNAEAPAAPAPYAIPLPDGVAVDAALVEQVTPLFETANVAPEQAQAIVAVYAAHVAAQETARVEAFAQQVQAWESATKADPEIGGAKLTQSIADAKRVLAQFGGEEVTALLNDGLGSHPAFVRMFAKIGAAIAESTTIRGSSGGAPASSTAAAFYPTMAAQE